MVEERTSGAVKLDPANLYRAVKRLIKQGLVQEAGRRSAPDAPDERRGYYAITKLGRLVVAEEACCQAELLKIAREHELLEKEGDTGMTEAFEQRTAWAEKWYRRLLFVLPSAFRTERARDMVETFRDQRRHELELGGSVRARSGAPAG